MNVCLLTSIYKRSFVGFSALSSWLIEDVATIVKRFSEFPSAQKESILSSSLSFSFPYHDTYTDARMHTDTNTLSICLCLFQEVEHTFRALVYFGDMLRNEICVRYRDIKHRVTVKVRWDASRIPSSQIRVWGIPSWSIRLAEIALQWRNSERGWF